MFIVRAVLSASPRRAGGLQTTNRSRFRRSRAFTLLEITFAVAILAMMSVAIYRFVQVNLAAIHISAEAAEADAPFDGLRDLLTAEWQSLPPGKGALLGDAYKLNDRSRDEIRWTCDAGQGLLTRYAPGIYTVAMHLQREDETSDKLVLGLIRKPKVDSSIADENESWVPLIRDVRSLQIRYFDPRINVWVERWTDAVTLPRLVKLVIERSDTSAPWELIVPLGRTPL
jgi:prepilin-type N-terminal cleavage/methylation domain-containing protein